MRILVTGAGGFIGSNVIHKLNERGYTNIEAVDDLTDGTKYRNLVGAKISDYHDKDSFFHRLTENHFGNFDYIFHEGACSDTTETDGKYMLANNFEISKTILNYCVREQVGLNYASSAAVYGASSMFCVSPDNELPLNVYGFSKLLFDNYVRNALVRCEAQVVGLRYFNVYGPREAHKGRMSSVVFHNYCQHKDNEPIKLFGGCGDYGPGTQKRDFINVNDVAEVKIWLMENPSVRGIFNLGTGDARDFNDLAMAVINGLNKLEGKQNETLRECLANQRLKYIKFPADLIGKYQCFTQADMNDLRLAGYKKEFMDLESGVAQYIEWLVDEERRYEL